MSGVVAVGLTNAASATLLALVAAAASRFVRRPALVHGLWLLVLLELLTPPVLVIDVLPALDPVEPVAHVTALSTEAAAVDLDGSLAASPAVQIPTWGQLAAAAWAAGIAALLLLALARGIRFERLLRRGAAAPAALNIRADAQARALGLRRAPVVRLVPARVSPLLWFRPGRMEIVFPAALVEQLEPPELDALLAHELAHVRRGDHWVRWIELAASALFFWHPVVWWARARMRSAEERSCDAWVATVLPAHARDYAGGVVKALEFLSPARGPVLPALASGVAQFRSLEERLAMILSHRTPPPATRAQRLALAATGIGLLLLFPAAAHRSSEEPQSEAAEVEAARGTEDASTAEMRSIRVELERLEQRRLELAQRLRELQARGDQDRLREEISRLDSEGRLHEARQLEIKAAQLERHAQLDRERVQLEQSRHEELAQLELEQVQAREELERALAGGHEEDVAEAKRRLAAVQDERESRSFAVEQKALALESLARKAQVEQIEQRRAELSGQGRLDEARQLEEELAALELELARADRGRHAAGERFGLEHEIRAMERRAEELASLGRARDAEALQRKIEELQRANEELGRSSRGRDIRTKIASLEAEIERMVELGDGHEEEIEALRGAIDELERRLERTRDEERRGGTVY